MSHLNKNLTDLCRWWRENRTPGAKLKKTVVAKALEGHELAGVDVFFFLSLDEIHAVIVNASAGLKTSFSQIADLNFQKKDELSARVAEANRNNKKPNSDDVFMTHVTIMNIMKLAFCIDIIDEVLGDA